MALSKLQRREKVKIRVRKKVVGTTEKPRLCVYRSNKQIYAQIIDDEKNLTICSSGSYKKGFHTGNKTDQAQKVGKEISELAKSKGIEQVIFDRNGYLYHGRIKALAEAAREGGLKF